MVEVVGAVYVEVALNIAREIDVQRIRAQLKEGPSSAFTNSPISPIRFEQPCAPVTVDGFGTDPTVSVTLYNFGGASFSFRFAVEGRNLCQVQELSVLLADGHPLVDAARGIASTLLSRFSSCISGADLTQAFEDYVVVVLNVVPDSSRERSSPSDALDDELKRHGALLTQIVMSKDEPVDEHLTSEVISGALRWYPWNRAVIERNAAILLVSRQDQAAKLDGVLEILALANAQDLQFALLEQECRGVSDMAEQVRARPKISVEALDRLRGIQLDMLELLHDVTSTAARSDDQFIARIHQLAAARFRFAEVEGRIRFDLEQVANVVQGIDSARRSDHATRLEQAIVALFVIDVVALFWPTLRSLFP